MAVRAETIDEIIERITEIVDEAKEDRSRIGYFPALYRKVTIRVKQGIEEGFFDDGERMERLDVIFARRYLDAFDEYRSGGTPTQSWLCLAGGGRAGRTGADLDRAPAAESIPGQRRNSRYQL